jgi:uncharacterized protein YlxW (UPF0749 family)
MKPAYVLIMAAAGFVLLFVFLNWTVLGAPITVTFGFARPTVPLGLILLGITLILLAVFLVSLLRVQLRLVSMHRRHDAELRSHRSLAENAESSRLAELRQYLQQELAALREEQARMEQRLQESITVTGNTLSACVGEVDERLERHFPERESRQP